MFDNTAVRCKIIGAKIAYYRTLSNLTQDELASRLHISRVTLVRIEKGTYNKNLSVPMITEIAQGLHIDDQLLFDCTDEEKRLCEENMNT